MRQAFREEFILHRTETEETMIIPGERDRDAGLNDAALCPHIQGGERTSRPASQDKTEASVFGAQQDCLVPGYVFC